MSGMSQIICVITDNHATAGKLDVKFKRKLYAYTPPEDIQVYPAGTRAPNDVQLVYH